METTRLAALPAVPSERSARMSKGDVVPVYEDPYSTHQLEGHARLIRRLSKAGDNVEFTGLQQWDVEFLDETGTYYSRLVGAPNRAHRIP